MEKYSFIYYDLEISFFFGIVQVTRKLKNLVLLATSSLAEVTSFSYQSAFIQIEIKDFGLSFLGLYAIKTMNSEI